LSKKKPSRRFGRLIFFVPTLLVIAIVAFGIANFISVQNSTLIVEASSSGQYSPSLQLHPQVTVGSTTKVSPFNITLPQGTYTVVFGEVTWYVTPTPRTVVLSGGKTEFADAVYDPVVREIAITSSGFNATSLTALHGVTPVVWVNLSEDVVVLNIKNLDSVSLSPGQNFTRIFSTTGTFDFSLLNTGFSGTIESL
jgi:hypothetical protein